jgi:hypothetical protein
MRMPEHRSHVWAANDYKSGARWIKGDSFQREAARILASEKAAVEEPMKEVAN